MSLNLEENYLRRIRIDEYCPKRKNKQGAPPKITGSGINVNKEVRFKAWIRPLKQPDENIQRVMMRESLKVVLTVIMKNHTYNFNNEIRKQKEGGAIGMDLTGYIANIFMSWWDRELIEKLATLGIKPFLYKRYVDDINMGVEAIDCNYSYIDKKITRRNDELNSNITEDKNTFDIIKTIGEEIHESIKLTCYVPSNYDDNKVPILDIKCWIENVNTDTGTSYMILHEHYIKDVSSKMVLHRDSAMSINSKRTILTQECLRILLNCNDKIGWNKIADHLTFFMLRMQASGYDHEFRLEILKSALNAHGKIKETEKDGGKMYRKRSWKRNERRQERKEKRKTWYTKGGYKSVLFIPATPNSELRDRLQQEINRMEIKIKVIERSGTKIIKHLQKNDPFKEKMCDDREKCLVCSGENPGGCRDTGISYKINCTEECEYEYTGQTSNNGYTRGKKHEEDYKAKREDSALWKHCVNVHQNETQIFKMTIVDKCRNDPTKRQILESIRMQKVPTEMRMNSRSEWNSTRLPRISINTNNK